MAYKIKLMVLGPVATNCYILYNDEFKEAVLIDPADRFEIIKKFIDEESLKLKAVLLTHGHFDHIGAAKEICGSYNVELYAHESEKEVLENPRYNLSEAMGAEQLSLTPDKELVDGQIIELIGLLIKVIHTPGHTPGGVCYYISSENILFSGDSLFACSIGRTDFPGGSSSDLIRAVREKLFTLPDGTKVFPGHGEQTSISYEKLHNPFVV